MAETGPFAVATFHSTHSVLKAETLLKKGGLALVRLVPVPSQISSDCGVTVRFLLRDLPRARVLLEPLEEDLEGVFTDSGGAWAPAPGAP